MYAEALSDILDQKSICIVDDNAAMRGILRSILSALGAAYIYEADTAKAAMDIICVENIDLVICDWKMTPVDGIALVRWIRDRKLSPNHKLPVLMLTCYADVKRVKQARDAGVNEFMAKPFTPESLYQHIRAIVQDERGFVTQGDFAGPDRRRVGSTFSGPDRRSLIAS